MQQDKHIDQGKLAPGDDTDEYVLINMKIADIEHNLVSQMEGGVITYLGSDVAVGVNNGFGASHMKNSPDNFFLGVGFTKPEFRNDVNNYFTSNVEYVDARGLYNSPTGAIHKPYLEVQDAVDHASNNATIYIAKGNYNESMIINSPMTLKAPVGKVNIGQNFTAKSASPQVSKGVSDYILDIINGRIAQLSPVELPEKGFALRSYPNTFSIGTQITYDLNDQESSQVLIYNLQGNLVKTLRNASFSQGKQQLMWDGRDQQGVIVKPGMYIIQVQQGDHSESIRVLKQ